MNYSIRDYDSAHFATALQVDSRTGELIWESSAGQEVLIVQSPYGLRVTDTAESVTGKPETLLEAIRAALSASEPEGGGYARLLPGIWVCFVSHADRLRLGGCPLHGQASTYSVVAVERRGGEGTLYLPREQAMMSPFCDIPLEIHAEVTRDALTRTTGIFRKRTEHLPTGFYRVSFSRKLSGGYLDGSLALRVRAGETALEIPVTAALVEAGEAFVKTDVAPEIVVRSRGLKLV